MKKKAKSPFKKKKKSPLHYIRAGFSAAAAYFRSFDDYGQPITFNYEGSDSFQTLPGALLSLTAKSILFIYFVYRGRSLLLNLNWSLATQTTNANEQDLAEIVTFNDNANFSLGIELDIGYTKLHVNSTKYENYSRAIHNYTILKQYNYQTNGLELEFLNGEVQEEFEKFNIYSRIKGNAMRVHELPKGDSLALNSYDKYEFRIDLSQMQLKGSVSSFNPLKTWFSAFFLYRDQERMYADAFENCRNDAECAPNLEEDAFIINAYHQYLNEISQYISEE